MQLLHRLAAGIWRRVGARGQWYVLRVAHATFLVGLTGVVLDDAGRVLVLRHRYWMGNPCGLPGGWAAGGETWEAGLEREIREETALVVRDVEVVRVRSGLKGRVEVLLRARAGGVPGADVLPRPDGREVLSAEFLDVDTARGRLRPDHVHLLDVALRTTAGHVHGPRAVPQAPTWDRGRP
jgi:8-oxo-dGTP diphosphatase